MAALLTFLSLRPGDTDRDYFDRYSVAADSKDLADTLWKRYVIEQEELPVEEEE